MKHLLLAAALVSLAPVAHADDIDVRTAEYLDAVEVADGSIWKGVVIEQVPGQTYKLETSDGSIHVFQAADVVKVTREKNRWRDDSARASASVALPPAVATSGLRASAALAIVFPAGDIRFTPTSFAPDVRVGYEAVAGNLGLEGGALVRWTDWRGEMATDDTSFTLETHASGRVAIHAGRAAPYVGLSLGTDTNYVYTSAIDMSKTSVSFGMNVQAGLPIAIAPGLAFEVGADYHPGTDTIVDGTAASISYFALRAGAAGRF